MKRTFSILAGVALLLMIGQAFAVVDDSYLQWPESGDEQSNANPITVYSRVLKTDCTGQCDSTECPDLTKWMFFRAQGQTEYDSLEMDLNHGDCYTPYDEYQVDLPVSHLSGDSVFFYAEFGDLDGVVEYTSAPGSEQFTFTAEEPANYPLSSATTDDFTLHVTGDFHCVTPNGQGPGISGTFNGWTYQQMTDLGDDLYGYDIFWPMGSPPIMEFKFRNGPDWENLGGPYDNREYEVAPGATEDDYFAYWSDEEECPCDEQPLTANQQVIFGVDMRHQDPASWAGGVSIKGSPTPLTWNAGANLLTDVDSDSVYTGLITFPAGELNTVDYKFVKSANGTDWEWENALPGNRFLCLPDNGFMVADVVFFDDYEPPTYTTVPIDVTFQVDMNCLDPGAYAGGVSVQGSAVPIDWTPGSTLMSDLDVDGVYDVIVTFPAGTLLDVEYKFTHSANGTDWNWEDGISNRQLTLDDATPVVVLDPVNWDDWYCPVHLDIAFDGGSLILSWEAVPSATSYTLEVYDEPYPAEEDEPVDTVVGTETEVTYPLPPDNRFFQVKYHTLP